MKAHNCLAFSLPLLVGLVAACSGAPTEDVATTSGAIVPEGQIPLTRYTFTIESVEVISAVEPPDSLTYDTGFQDWGELGFKVTSVNPAISANPYVTACMLSPTPAGAPLNNCHSGAIQNGPFNPNQPLSVQVPVGDPSDRVEVAVALHNVEAASPSNVNSSMATILHQEGDVVSGAGAIVALAGSEGLGGLIGLVGTAASLAADGMSGSGHLVNYGCAGGLVANPPGGFKVTEGQTGTGALDTLFLGTAADRPFFTPQELEAMTANGTARFVADVAVGAPPYAIMCMSHHKIHVAIDRDWGTGVGPSPKSADGAVARLATETDTFWPDTQLGRFGTIDRRFAGSQGWQTSYGATNTAITRTTPIAAVSRTPTNVDAFWVDEYGSLTTSIWSPASPSPAILTILAAGGAPAHASVTAAARKPSRLDVFFVGNDGAVYTSFWSDGAAWKTIPVTGPFVAPPGAGVAAVARNNSSLDLFFIGNDGALHTSYWYEGAPTWTTLAVSPAGIAPKGGNVTAASPTTLSLEAFFVGNNGALYQSSWSKDPQWVTRAVTQAGLAAAGASLSAVSRLYSNLDVAFLGKAGQVYVASSFSTAPWSGGEPWHVAPVNDPRSLFATGNVSIAARTSWNLDVFFEDLGGRPSSADWSSSAGTWTLATVPFATANTGGLLPFAGTAANKCVDVLNGSGAPGALLEIFDCNDTWAQRFAFNVAEPQMSVGGQVGGQIVSKMNPNLCFDYSAPSITLQPCGSSINQSWSFSEGVFRATGGKASSCLDVAGGSRANNARLVLSGCNGAASQLFMPFDLPMQIGTNQSYALPLTRPIIPQCIDILNDSETTGASLETYFCNGGHAQAFTYTEHNQLVVGGLCVEVTDIAGGYAGKIRLEACNDNPTQRWYFDGVHFQSVPVLARLAPNPSIMGCMDVLFNGQTPNTAIDYATCNGSAAQVWTLGGYQNPAWPFGVILPN